MSPVQQELMEEMAAERIAQAQAALVVQIVAARLGPLPADVSAHLARLPASASDWECQAIALATADSLDTVRRILAAL